MDFGDDDDLEEDWDEETGFAMPFDEEDEEQAGFHHHVSRKLFDFGTEDQMTDAVA